MSVCRMAAGSMCAVLSEDFCSSLQQEYSPPSGPSTAQPAAQLQRTAIHKPFTQSRLPTELPAHPAPRHITTQELQVLESCFHRWRAEVEKDVHGKSALPPSLWVHHLSLCLPPYAWDLVLTRPPGQHQQNPQDRGAHVLGQIHDAG